MKKIISKIIGNKDLCGRLLNDGRIFLVVLLGISGMFLNFTNLLTHLKTSPYKKEYWIVKDYGKRIERGQVVTVDTLRVVYHPQIGLHLDTARKAYQQAIKQHTPINKENGSHLLDYGRFYFAYNSDFLVWIAFGSIVVGFGLAFTPVLIVSIWRLVKRFKIKWWTLTFIGLFIAIIGFLMYDTSADYYLTGTIGLCNQFHILFDHPDSLKKYVVVGIIVGLLGFAGQMTVNSAIGRLPASVGGLDDTAQKKVGMDFQLLRSQLKLFLVIDSFMVVFAVLTTDAFRRAIISEIQVNLDIMPQNFVYLYGLMYTFYLAVIYMPIYSRLKTKGEQMLQDVSLTDQEGKMKGIASILRIRQTPVESLQVVISILAPVLSSLVPGLLKL